MGVHKADATGDGSAADPPEPLPDGGGAQEAQTRERAAQEGQRDPFKSKRLLRQQTAVGCSEKRARFAFVLLHEHEYTVSEMCRVLGVSRQGYYQWRRRPASAHALRDAELAAEIRRVFEASRRTYGSPRVFARPRRDGAVASEKRVARIMAERGWAGASRRRAKSPAGAEKRVCREDGAEDLVGRDFTAGGPNEAWFADITYVRTRQGWLYLAVVMDIWSRMVVGWSMGERIDAALVDDALGMAVARRTPPRAASTTLTTAASTPRCCWGRPCGSTGSGRRWGPWRAPGTTRPPSPSWAP